jgi:hypothetical protein
MRCPQEGAERMAKVKIADIIEHLDHDIQRALEAAVQELVPNANLDRNALFRAFLRAVGRKCNTWETVPSSCVRVD